jgi:rRNA maturation endonuclease Nob1
MIYVNRGDFVAVEIEHLQKLRGSGYDFSCSDCNYMYKKRPERCDICDSNVFIRTTEVIRKLELGID